MRMLVFPAEKPVDSAHAGSGITKKVPAAVHLTKGRSRLGCIDLGLFSDNPHGTALRREPRGSGGGGAMNARLIAINKGHCQVKAI